MSDPTEQTPINVEKSGTPRPRNFFLRLLLAFFVVFIALVPSILFKKMMPDPHVYWARLIQLALVLGLVTLAYRWYVRTFERRKMSELGGQGALRELSIGMAVGAGLIVLTIGVLAVFGYYAVDGVGFSQGVIRILFISIITGYLEELTSRGIIFRLFEEGTGSWIALAVSAVYFGAAHLSNDGATLFSGFAVAVEFGVVLALAYMVTRRLWFVIGYHFAWNFTLGGVFGITVSGLEVEGVLHGRLEGPNWATGGGFGPESSIVCVLLSLIAVVVLYRMAVARGAIVAMPWKKVKSREPGI